MALSIGLVEDGEVDLLGQLRIRVDAKPLVMESCSGLILEERCWGSQSQQERSRQPWKFWMIPCEGVLLDAPQDRVSSEAY